MASSFLALYNKVFWKFPWPSDKISHIFQPPGYWPNFTYFSETAIVLSHWDSGFYLSQQLLSPILWSLFSLWGRTLWKSWMRSKSPLLSNTCSLIQVRICISYLTYFLQTSILNFLQGSFLCLDLPLKSLNVQFKEENTCSRDFAMRVRHYKSKYSFLYQLY